MKFDAHAHLPEREDFSLPADWSGVVCAVRESDFENLSSLAKKNGGIIPAFGLHPWFLRERDANWLETLRRFLESTPRAQVGEIGLDKIRVHEVSLDEQTNIFISQLQLAIELNIPANIHCVRAWNELLRIFHAEKQIPKLHFHAFSGSPEIARELLRLADATFSFSPKQRDSEKLRRVREAIPPERIFEESDAALGSI